MTKMSDRVELARIELEIAEDIERITAAEIIRWLQHRREHAVTAWVKRAAAAIGRAKRLRASPPEQPAAPAGHEICSACKRVFKFGDTCTRGGCPCGGDV